MEGQQFGLGGLMNPVWMFENPAMAEQQMLNQLLAEQHQFWYWFRVHPPQNDGERQQAIGALGQRRGRLSVLQGDAMFLSNQGYGRLLMAVSQELNAVVAAQTQYLNDLQTPYQPAPSAPPPQPAPRAPMPSSSGPDDVLAMLVRSSREQGKIRARMVDDCIHCKLPTEGKAECPHCGRYQHLLP